eukprot:jgi/Mesen1/2050/ME000150S01139
MLKFADGLIRGGIEQVTKQIVQEPAMADLVDERSEPWFSKVTYQIQESGVYSQSKRAVSTTLSATKELLWTTGMAAWTAGSSFLVLLPGYIRQSHPHQEHDIAIVEGRV